VSADDVGILHESSSSESPSRAVTFCLLLAVLVGLIALSVRAGADDDADEAWDEAAALLLVRTGSDRGARRLGGVCFDR
jgi:hypothetical protein